jgi:tetratricopeptide (TPR) repeat protein
LLWRQVLAESPRHAPAYIGAGNALRELGEHAAAEEVLSVGAGYFPEHQQIAFGRAWTANARRDWAVAIGRWEDVCARFPDQKQGYNGMAQALRGANRLADLAAFLAAAQARLDIAATDPAEAARRLDLRFEIARLRQDWPGVKLCAQAIIARDAAPAAAIYLGLSQAEWHLGQLAAADAAAVAALAINPAATEAVVIRLRVATARGDGAAALDCYQRLAALHPNTSAWRLKRAQLLNWLGQLDESLAETEALLRRWPDDPMVRVFLRNFGLAAELLPRIDKPPAQNPAFDPDAAERSELRRLAERAPVASGRAGIAADPRCDVTIPEGARSGTALLVFTGTNDAVAMPLPIFDRYLAPLDVTPIYLRDFNRMRYLDGIRSIADNLEDSIAWLRGMLRDKGFARLCVLGNCAGGFAAIRYGVALGAERIITFDAPSHCPDEALTRLEQGQNFMRTRLLSRYPGEMTDLKPFLEAHPPAGRIALFYQIEDPMKRIQAERLRDVPGVRLHPEPGVGDNRLLRRIALSCEDFSQWLADLILVERLPGQP